MSPDTDGDGPLNVLDNCPWVPNPDQLDMNGDSIGDVCYVVELAISDLEVRSGRPVAQSLLIEDAVPVVEDVVWSDSRLGVPSNEPCGQVEVPGYRVIFTAMTRGPGEKHLCHTDKIQIIQYVGLINSPQ